MISNELLNEAETLARQIAPELFDNAGLYFTSIDQLDVPLNQSCYGQALIGGHAMSLDAMDAVGVDRPGPIIAINAASIAEVYGFGDDFEAAFFSVVCHELGHCVPSQPYPSREQLEWDRSLLELDDDELRKLQRARLESSAGESSADLMEQRKYHGIDFARRAIHLWFRAKVGGWNVISHGLLNGCGPLTWPIYFCEALLHECDQLRDATFEEIEQLDPPESFVEYWNHSTGICSNPEPEENDAAPI